MPPACGTVAAARFVPEPRGITGMRRSAARPTTAATSTVLAGKTIASGTPRCSGVASAP